MIKQNNMVLVVDNLPQTLAIVDVKDYFARDATQEIASVLLQKTQGGHRASIKYNCPSACEKALRRFDAASFRGRKLACRIEDIYSTTEHTTVDASTSVAKTWATPSTEWAPRGVIIEVHDATCVRWEART